MVIEPIEAAVVLRVLKEFAEGCSKSEIVERLNKEGVPGRINGGTGTPH